MREREREVRGGRESKKREVSRERQVYCTNQQFASPPSILSFSADNLPYPVQETTTDNTTPSVVAQLDEGKNDKSATCLTNHDRKIYTAKSTQMPVPSDKCSSSHAFEYESMIGKAYHCSDNFAVSSQTPTSFDKYSTPLEYEYMDRKVCQRSEDSAVCSETSIPFDKYSSPLEYEPTTEKPYQCSESSTVCSHTIIKLSHKHIPWKLGPGFLVYACDNAGKKINVQTADHTIDEVKVTFPIALQGESKDDKSTNSLTNARSNPIAPLDQSTQISLLSDDLEYKSITAIAQQCTEDFPSNSGYCLVVASSKMTTPQEIDSALLMCSPGCGFWPKSTMTDKQSTVAIDYIHGSAKHNETASADLTTFPVYNGRKPANGTRYLSSKY